MTLNTLLNNLHPIMREKVQGLITHLGQKDNPIQLIEGYRTPVQQQELHTQGAAEKPWLSVFQYGLACKFGVVLPQQGTPLESSELDNYWAQFHKFAKAAGLEIMDSEPSQLQFPGVSAEALIKGQYPAGGDESWQSNLELHITYWNEYPKPPVPMLGNTPISHLNERDEKSTQ
ncbi:M15 family metallopeptidase domain-containing protein [Aliiglaciecola aliphaticivorans]